MFGSDSPDPPSPPSSHYVAMQPSAPSMSTVPDPEAQLLRQQMDQITSDFKYNLKVCMRG